MEASEIQAQSDKVVESYCGELDKLMTSVGAAIDKMTTEPFTTDEIEQILCKLQMQIYFIQSKATSLDIHAKIASYDLRVAKKSKGDVDGKAKDDILYSSTLGAINNRVSDAGELALTFKKMLQRRISDVTQYAQVRNRGAE